MKGILKKIMATVLTGAMMVSVFVGSGVEVKAVEYTTAGINDNTLKDMVLNEGDTIKAQAYAGDNWFYCYEFYVDNKEVGRSIFENQSEEVILPVPFGYTWTISDIRGRQTNDKVETSVGDRYEYFYYVYITQNPIQKPNEGGTEIINSISNTKPSAPAHTHSYSWVIESEATEGSDGVEVYKCSCGDVQTKSVIPASQAYVSKFRDLVKNAPTNGTVNYDSKMNHTFSDYIIKRMAERTDVITVIDFKLNHKDYTMTIPAGIDYTTILADDVEFYGYFYFAQLTGASIVAK